jgi:hypothetical protein
MWVHWTSITIANRVHESLKCSIDPLRLSVYALSSSFRMYLEIHIAKSNENLLGKACGCRQVHYKESCPFQPICLRLLSK